MRLATGMIVGVLALAGCGGGDENADADIVRPGEPLYCPAENDGSPAASGTFDARDLLGLSVEDAEQRAEAAGCTVRVLSEDGEERAATMDLRIDRVNVEVRDGIVVVLRNIG